MVGSLFNSEPVFLLYKKFLAITRESGGEKALQNRC